MRIRVLVAPLTVALLASTASAADRPSKNTRYDRALGAAASQPQTQSEARMAVVSTEGARGVPSLSLATLPFPKAPASITAPAAVARHFLRERADLYRVPEQLVDEAQLRSVHDTGRGGIIVTLGQRIGGVEVFHNAIKVLLTRNLELVAIGGNLRAEADGSHNLGSFLRQADDAVATAFTDLRSITLTPSALSHARATTGGYISFDLAPTGAVKQADLIFTTPARAKKVWFPMAGTLRPAHYVELFVGKIDEVDSQAYAYVIAADDGQILFRQNLTKQESFDYRVFAEPTAEGRPLDGPIEDFTPHPTGIPDGSFPASIAPALVSMEGFNNSPGGAPDPWLPDGATQTFGNNVNAYTDDDAPDGFSQNDLVATTTSPGTFDWVFDTSVSANETDAQKAATVTNLFYVNNWLHDYFYDSGFDEEAGNAQLDNYGRGGIEGDPLRAEAQDASGFNNANMATPADGLSPRMQMYLWTTQQEEITLSVGAPLSQSYPTIAAGFGPSDFDVTAPLTLVDDGNAPATDACEAIDNDLTGTIAVIDRGSCTFVSKVNRAETAGAVGAIIINNQPNAGPMEMQGSGSSSIGALSMSLENGNDLKAALAGGSVTGTLTRDLGLLIDSSLDNATVAHEWGHYMHNRLVLCTTNQCRGEGEGWGDFLALFAAVREGDDFDGTYGNGIYISTFSSDPAYFGIRRVPYTVDATKNPLTFKHIQDNTALPSGFPINPSSAPNSEVHRTGEIWASMLWEGYYRLLQRTLGPSPAYSFAEARRRMADYVVAGMQLAPDDPTFTEQRDALFAAAAASDTDDMLALAEGFAVRGAGSCAVSPPRDATDNIGVTESFEVAPALSVESVTLSDDVDSCDDDGLLDAGERGTILIEVENRGPVALDNGTITLKTDTAGVTIDGATLDVAALAPFEVGTVSAEIALAPEIADPEGLDLELLVEAPEACEPSLTRSEAFRINYDNQPEAGAGTDFDSDIVAMLPVGAENDVIWSRRDYEPLDVVWRGIDIGHISDTYIETPELEVSEDEDLVLTMVHRHKFEVSDGTFWDAGVIEIKRNTDTSWQDVADYDDPGYDGPVSNEADNPLSDRMAFVGDNPSWPDTDEITVELGNNFAGSKVKLRFRIGTDQAASDFGWEIHSLELSGITNGPFPSIAPDATACGEGLSADAGPDREVAAGTRVTLDGSGSHDPDGDELTFTWEQTAGPDVALDDPDSIAPQFDAPEEETSVTFTLTVSDGTHEDVDDVTIAVVTDPAEEIQPLVIGSGCGCDIPGRPDDDGTPTWLALLAGAALLRRRRE